MLRAQLERTLLPTRCTGTAATWPCSGRPWTGSLSSEARVSLGELGPGQAAARAPVAYRRAVPGALLRFEWGPEEDTAWFAGRVNTGQGATAVDADTVEAVDLGFVLRAYVPFEDGASVYALHPGTLDGAPVNLVTDLDVVTALVPDA